MIKSMNASNQIRTLLREIKVSQKCTTLAGLTSRVILHHIFTHSGTPTGTGSKPALSNMLHVTWPRQFVQTMTFVFRAINYHPEPHREGLERRQRISQSHSHLRC